MPGLMDGLAPMVDGRGMVHRLDGRVCRDLVSVYRARGNPGLMVCH